MLFVNDDWEDWSDFSDNRLAFDGGITDNLGLHALYDLVTLSGGAETQ